MKIAVAGGGSSYTPELVDGILADREKIGVREIALMDVDPKRLRTVSDFCRRMAAARKADVTVSDTTDLERAASGADFVVAQIRVGGNRSRVEDERLGMRHGLIGQETTGVGGFAKALRTVPAMLDICKVMERACPSAFLVNFTNPSGLVTEAILKYGRVRAVGLCNIPVTFQVEVAKLLAARREDVELDYVGLNHLSWIRGVRLRGEQVIGRLIELGGSPARPANIEELDYPVEFIRALGMVPMHYLRYYYMTGRMLAEQGKKEKTRGQEVMEIERELMEIYADPKSDRKPDMLSRRGGAHYSLAALELMKAIRFDEGSVQILDVQNNGAMPGLPDDSVIECSCRVGASGPRPLPMAAPPAEVMGLIRAVKSYEELAVEAAVKRSREKALLALAAHPLGPDADNAAEVLDDLCATHAIELH